VSLFTTETVGLIAGVLTTMSFVPQALKSWRSRSVKDFSTAMLTTFTTGVFLWMVYGFRIGATPIIVSNMVTFLLALALLGMKWRFR
jgi:MtN3 and saliva related transmembrane protein